MSQYLLGIYQVPALCWAQGVRGAEDKQQALGRREAIVWTQAQERQSSRGADQSVGCTVRGLRASVGEGRGEAGPCLYPVLKQPGTWPPPDAKS